MSEAEAIAKINDLKKRLSLATHGSRTFEALDLALKLLRAQEQNEPLTCDGCEFDRRQSPSEAFARCDSCVRQERSWMSDRYEPKGADQ